MKIRVLILFLLYSSIIAQDVLKLFKEITFEEDEYYYSQVSFMGDFNKDGYSDFVMSSPKFIRIYWGEKNFDISNFSLIPTNDSFTIQSTIATKGDLNNDSISDIVFTGYKNFGFEKELFRIYLLLSDKTNNYKLKTFMTFPIGRNFWFHGLTINGDINGDSYNDIIIGESTIPMGYGQISIYLGGNEIDTIPDLIVKGTELSGHFGFNPEYISDLNGDGYSELLVGEPKILADAPIGNSYLFYGGKEISFKSSVQFSDTNNYNRWYGIRNTSLGDINGDGYSDFAITSRLFIDVFSGKTLKLIERYFTHPDWGSPRVISNGSDLNKDGYSDFIIGYESGNINIFMGSSNFSTLPYYVYYGEIKNFNEDFTIEIGGDINGDGQKEIIFNVIETQNIDGQFKNTKKIYIYSWNESNTNIAETKSLPMVAALFQNYPNPFNPSTIISYSIPTYQHVKLIIYDSLGRLIKILLDEDKLPGIHKYTFDGKDYPSGIYFCQIITKEFSKTIKMILLK